MIYLQSDDFRKLLIDLENKNFSNVFDDLKKIQWSQDTNIPIQYSNLLDFVNFDFFKLHENESVYERKVFCSSKSVENKDDTVDVL